MLHQKDDIPSLLVISMNISKLALKGDSFPMTASWKIILMMDKHIERIDVSVVVFEHYSQVGSLQKRYELLYYYHLIQTYQ